jgi:hypothetical protein
LVTKNKLSIIKKKAKKAGWIAGETPISCLSIDKFSRLCGLRIEERGKKRQKFGKKLRGILKLKTKNS